MIHEIQQSYEGERALFQAQNLKLSYCRFHDGESPLKESNNIQLSYCLFQWKYPLWYSKDIVMNSCSLFEEARSGIWYTSNIKIENSTIQAPKTFRRSQQIELVNCELLHAQETLWNCQDIILKHVSANGDYFGMNSENITAEHFTLNGNYAFDGACNLTIKNARLLSKDAFWNCKNVTVSDSEIYGEYLGWNSENITFENCTIQSLQGLCYMKNVKLIHCRLIDTTLAFEYSDVNAIIDGSVESVKNPSSAHIQAEKINELILDDADINSEQIKIITEDEYDKTTA